MADDNQLKWEEQHEGKQWQDLSKKEQRHGDMRFVCEGCGTIVKYESDLEYISQDEMSAEYQLCSDCVKTHEN